MGSASVQRQREPRKPHFLSKLLRSARHLLTCHEVDDIRLYRKDCLLCLAENLNCTKTGTLFLVYSAFFLGIKLVLARISDALYFQDWSLIPQDLHRFPPFRLIVTLFRGPYAVSGTNPAAIPYLRDYSDLVVMILMASHMALIHRQWKDISIAIKELSSKHVLNPAIMTPKHLKSVVEKYDRLANLRSVRVLSRIAAVGTVALFYRSFAHAGIYSGLNIPFVAGWEKVAYLHWSENPQFHPMFFLYSAFVASFLMYYMIRHNVVGIIALLMCKDVLGVEGHGVQPLLRLQPDDKDGMAGVKILRDIMYRVYLSMVLMGLALIMIYYRVGTHTAAALVPLYAIFFGLNPLYIFIPLHFIGKGIRIAKQHQLNRLNLEYDHIMIRSGNPERVLKHRAVISDIPDYLFSRERLWSVTVSSVIPLIVFVDWVANHALPR